MDVRVSRTGDRGQTPCRSTCAAPRHAAFARRHRALEATVRPDKSSPRQARACRRSTRPLPRGLDRDGDRSARRRNAPRRIRGRNRSSALSGRGPRPGTLERSTPTDKRRSRAIGLGHSTKSCPAGTSPVGELRITIRGCKRRAGRGDRAVGTCEGRSAAVEPDGRCLPRADACDVRRGTPRHLERSKTGRSPPGDTDAWRCLNHSCRPSATHCCTERDVRGKLEDPGIPAFCGLQGSW